MTAVYVGDAVHDAARYAPWAVTRAYGSDDTVLYSLAPGVLVSPL